MKAAVYYNNKDVRLEEVPMPEIGDGELLVRIMASGICGTDVMEWYRIKKAPRILGHEIAGEVVEAGGGVSGFKTGDRVFVSHHVPCNACKHCAEGNHTACETLHTGNYDPGGFCEYVRVPALNVTNGTYVLPDNVSYEEGSMSEPLACAVRGQRVIGVKKNHVVLILGCGVSGLMNIQIAKLKGARVIATDMNESRLTKALQMGADEAVRAGEPLDVKADRVIICTGAMAAAEQAFRRIDSKGVILFFAIPDRNVSLPIVDFWRNELTVTSSYGAAPEDLAGALALIRDNKTDMAGLITHRLPLDEIQAGFEIAAAAAGGSLKVIIFPHGVNA
jgi:L-iditol 2-dehydrogenase